MNHSKPHATLKDIADEVGLSVSTISRALRNHPLIKQETIELVKEKARELEYFPDTVARNLQKKSTSTIGVIVPEIRHDFFSSAIDGIEDRAYQSGYTIIVTKSNEDSDREVLNSRTLVSHRVAGIIASVAQRTDNPEHFMAVQRRGIPVVLFDRVLDDLIASKVIVDDYRGAYNSTKHLIECGYRRIAHLAGPANLKISGERARGYKAALLDAGIEIDPKMIVEVDLDEKSGAKGLRTLLALNERPDAVFAVNDPVAVGAHKEIRSQGYNIPKDMGITGFSNNPITEMIEPPLTTVDQHGFKMGQVAADLLLQEIEGNADDWTPETRIVETELIIRQSSACKREDKIENEIAD
jgi:DNA-binding LacI/PurR family transcriptional regulator